MNSDSKSIKQFNLQNYFIEVKLFHRNEKNDIIDEKILNPQAIFQLVIEDNLHFWPTKGFFVYDNTNEILERKMVSNKTLEGDTELNNIIKTNKPFVFRNDGRDFLNITIYPILDDNQQANNDLKITKLPPDIWNIKHECVIYDKEDINVSNITQKMKKFYFWDKSYQQMLDKKIQWSTATSLQNQTYKERGVRYNPIIATDDEREMLIGDAIKDILKTNGFEIHVDKNGVESFDKGSVKIFYSTHQDMNIWENIEYLLNQHMSQKTTNTEPIDQTDICIFYQDRQSGKFVLEPLYKFFEKAGNSSDMPREYQLEHLFFDDIGDPGITTYKSPIMNDISSTKDIKINKIRKYQFVDMSSADNTHMIATIPVYSYDFKNKTFSINLNDSNVNIIEDKLSKLYIENKVLSKNGSHPLVTLNQNKIKNNTINPVYSIRSDKASITRKGLGKLLYSSVFLNQCIVFDLDGATFRRSGRFVGIDRQNFSDNTLDYKLCGQWFVTNVKHVFYGGQYHNEITAIKIHSYEDLNISKDIL